MAWMDPQVGAATQATVATEAATGARRITVHWFVPASPWIYRHPRWDGNLELELAPHSTPWHNRLGALARRYGG